MSTVDMWQAILLLLALKAGSIFWVFFMTVGLETKEDELRYKRNCHDD